ncbi:MAG: RidA family protein [Acaryochloridaceae cyanobacterium CSU_5_19]|nr:RidA family protein [Acaryochloridaceae cyanobacterium CSU_5_19]
MSQDVIHTDQAPAPVGPYNQAIRADGSFIFVSGQIALDPTSGAPVGGKDVGQQTEQVMKNLGAVLAAAGVGWSQVVKTTVFLADMNDFGIVNAIYGRYFEAETAPARACVEVSRLPKDMLVEIDCIALVLRQDNE